MRPRRRVSTSTIRKSTAGSALAYAHRVEIVWGEYSRKGAAVFYRNRVSFHPAGGYAAEDL